MEFVPLTEELVSRFTKIDKTVRGFAVKKDGEVLSVIGVYAEQERFVLFCDADRKDLSHMWARKLVILATRKMMALLKSLNGPVFALADEAYGSERLLEHLGFHRVNGKIYKWVHTQE